MSEITSKTELLDLARKLSKEAETSTLKLALVLAEICDIGAFTAEYDTFPEFCLNELNLGKSAVSKLLTVATFLKTHGYINESGVSAQKLYAAIKAFPNKEPQYQLSAAKNLSLREIEKERKDPNDDCSHEKTITICAHCSKRI